MYRLRPKKGFLLLGIMIGVIGGLGFWYYDTLAAAGDIHAAKVSRLILVFTIIGAGLSFIIATSRFWFKHLWHRRK